MVYVNSLISKSDQNEYGSKLFDIHVVVFQKGADNFKAD